MAAPWIGACPRANAIAHGVRRINSWGVFEPLLHGSRARLPLVPTLSPLCENAQWGDGEVRLFRRSEENALVRPPP